MLWTGTKPYRRLLIPNPNPVYRLLVQNLFFFPPPFCPVLQPLSFYKSERAFLGNSVSLSGLSGLLTRLPAPVWRTSLSDHQVPRLHHESCKVCSSSIQPGWISRTHLRALPDFTTNPGTFLCKSQHGVFYWGRRQESSLLPTYTSSPSRVPGPWCGRGCQPAASPRSQFSLCCSQYTQQRHLQAEDCCWRSLPFPPQPLQASDPAPGAVLSILLLA